MKAYELIAAVKGQEVKSTVFAYTKEDAKQIARQEMGYKIKGEFFSLHWSEILGVKRVK